MPVNTGKYREPDYAPISTMDVLFEKSELFRDFKAVREGYVWGADQYLYQATDLAGKLIIDFYYMLHREAETQMTLKKIVKD